MTIRVSKIHDVFMTSVDGKQKTKQNRGMLKKKIRANIYT